MLFIVVNLAQTMSSYFIGFGLWFLCTYKGTPKIWEGLLNSGFWSEYFWGNHPHEPCALRKSIPTTSFFSFLIFFLHKL